MTVAYLCADSYNNSLERTPHGEVSSWRGDWWVDAYFACDLFPDEVNGMSAAALASTLWKFSHSYTASVAKRVTTQDRKANNRLEKDLRPARYARRSRPFSLIR